LVAPGAHRTLAVVSERPLLLAAVLLPLLAAGGAAARPLVAVVAENEGTEITDFVVPYGVLVQSGAADVVDVAVRSGAVSFLPALALEARETIASFDAKHPDGADYVVVPAVHRSDSPALLAWLRAQAERGATIVGVCDGAWVLARAGLLEERAATGHWYSFDDLAEEFPRTRWVKDRRWVRDGPMMTTTGVSASLPAALELVSEIAGEERARAVASELGVAAWDAAHESARYRLDAGHMATAAGNWLALWRWERVGIPIASGVDEIALAFTVDAHGRTYRTTALGLAESAEPVTSRRGLRLLPDAFASAAAFDRIEELPRDEVAPARALDHALARIDELHGEGTARFVALQLEYPWR
jgi:putative intracellular protease/amidase